ncbi:MAG: DUF3991 domain-containing protein, partial [Oscillospiraceae bacterium]|nr:DUF3991 domain-containing protein [Oscillospiraceae bacterium]
MTWTAEKDRDYTVTVEALAPDYAYIDNAYFVFHGNDTCYLTGLRENNEYKITVEPELKANEKYTVKPISKNCRTEQVEVIEEFPHEDGWTNAMSYERAGGLTRQPSSGAICGSVPDPITRTGIRRDEYGDYCCAMGLFYGTCGDRFLVELENGTQFTVKICDSKPVEIHLRENPDCRKVTDYLCRVRKLDFQLVSELIREGKISQESGYYGNVIFKCFDENNKLVGAEKCGTNEG